LPYEKDFDERNIPTKAHPTQKKFEYLELCKKKIQSVLDKGLIRHSKSPWTFVHLILIMQERRNAESHDLLLAIDVLTKFFNGLDI